MGGGVQSATPLCADMPYAAGKKGDLRTARILSYPFICSWSPSVISAAYQTIGRAGMLEACRCLPG